jgi:alpha/beta superfamily hydrolase
VLRFNFRGVEKSEGEHGAGEGEQDDVRAGLDYLTKEFPGRKIILGGFSFGSWVALRVGCADVRVAELIGIGIPVNNVDMSYLRDCTKPKLFVQGGDDQFGSRKNVEKLFATLPEPKQLTFVENADHFFTGKLELLGAAIDAWMEERHPR